MNDMLKDKKKQDRAIKKAKQGQIYVKDKQGNVSFQDFGDMEIHDQNTLSQFITTQNKQYANLITQFHTLINSLKDAQFVYPNKQYVVTGLKNGYICKGNDYVVELTVDESELYKGYCIIENHKVVIDEKQKEKYLRTFKGGIL